MIDARLKGISDINALALLCYWLLHRGSWLIAWGTWAVRLANMVKDGCPPLFYRQIFSVISLLIAFRPELLGALFAHLKWRLPSRWPEIQFCTIAFVVAALHGGVILEIHCSPISDTL